MLYPCALPSLFLAREQNPSFQVGSEIVEAVKERCIVIPAIKKNAVIPDQLVKKLAGVTLMERAIHTARAV